MGLAGRVDGRDRLLAALEPLIGGGREQSGLAAHRGAAVDSAMRLSVAAVSILALVLVAAGGWAMWGNGGASTAPVAGTLGPTDAGGPSARRPELEGSAWGPLEGAAPGGRAQVDPGIARREEDAGQGATVTLVVRYPDGRAAAGAQVRWMTRDELRDRNDRGGHPTAALDPTHPQATTAADGTVPIPAGVERLYVSAALGGDYGYRQLRTDGAWDVERNRILLVPDSSLTLTVRHPDGRGAGDVRTAIQQARGRGWRSIARATTDSEGVARFAHLQLSQQRFGREGGYLNRFRTFVDVPIREPIVGVFQLPSRESMELVLPPTAPLTIEVHGPEAHPLGAAARVRLTRLVEDLEEAPESFSHEARMEPWTGNVTFPLVETGLAWTPSIQPPDGDLAWTGAPAPGPSTVDAPAVITVQPPSWMAAVCGTLVRSGEPLRGLRAQFLLAGLHGRVEGEPLTTGPNGQFELLVHKREHHLGPYLLDVLQERERTGSAAPVPHVTEGRRTELGALEVADLPIFAEGVVVDDAGTPVPRAMVRRLRQQGEPERARWMADPGVRAFADEDGRFALFAAPGRGPWVVEAMARNHRMHRSEPMQQPPPLRIVLQRTGRLIGLAPAPRWLSSNAVDLTVAPVDGGRPARARVDVRREELTFRTNDLDPGAYRVTLSVRGFDEPLYDNANVWVGPGEQELDPPLPDLTERLFRYRLQAVASSGAELPPMRSPLVVRYRTLDGSELVTGFPWRGRRIEVIASSPTIEVAWMNTGCRPQSAILSAGDHELLFEILQPVELTVEGARDAVGPDQRVRVSMVLVGDSGLPEGMRARDQGTGDGRNYSRAQLGKSSGAWLPEHGGPMSVPLMLDGDYRVVMRIHGRDRQPRSHTVATVPVRLDPLQPTRIVVQADPQKIEADLEALRTGSGR